MVRNLFQHKEHLQSRKLQIDGKPYRIQVRQCVFEPEIVPRLVVVAYQPNQLAQSILQTCIQAIEYYTSHSYELWVVDNNSPLKNTKWLLEHSNVNVVLNRTDPVPPSKRSILTRLKNWRSQMRDEMPQSLWGSYANAIGLEVAIRLINPRTHYLMSLHMDTMPCHDGWLSFLRSKLGRGTGAAGVRLDKVRTPDGVLHVLGYLVDFRLFKKLNLDFFPHLPQYDVGDRVTIALRKAGYDIFACRNTLWDAGLIEKIPMSSPLRHLHVDRSFDDDGNIIFLHLGRGIVQTLGRYTGKTTPEEWIEFANSQGFISSKYTT